MQNDNSARDRALDAALAGYAAVEPPAGLEQRVLSNLRAQRQADAARPSRLRPALTALAVAASLAVVAANWWTRSKTFTPATSPGRASREHVANDSRPAVAPQRDVGALALESGRRRRPAQSTGQMEASVANRFAARELPQSGTATEAAPHLERFPAPERLTEQEKLLVRFVEDDPQEAALVAEARAEQLRREYEEMQAFVEGPAQAQQQR